MPDYTEEIYERAERLFTTDAAKKNWLDGFKTPRHSSGATPYELDGIRVADAMDAAESLNGRLKTANTFSEFSSIASEAEGQEVPFYTQEIFNEAEFKKNQIINTTSSIEELQELRDEASSLNDSDALDKLERKLDTEAQRITPQQEDDVDELVSKYKEGSAEERIAAEERLRDIAPRKLGGIKSGESRRAKSAARSIFEE